MSGASLRLRRALVALLVSASGGGCRTRLLEAGHDQLPDLASPPDFATACFQHELVATPITEMNLLNPVPIDLGQQRLGSVIRLQLGVPLRPCEAFGDVTVRVMPGHSGADFVVVTVRVWRSTADCGPAATGYRVAYLWPELGLGNPRVTVADGAPGGTTTASFQVLDWPPKASCDTVVRPSERCQLDCQCRNGDVRTRCILDTPNDGACAIPCEEDADCPAGARCQTNGDYTCAPSSSQACGRCPIGQTCRTDGCRPAPPAGSAPPHCACDGDCPSGRLCNTGGSCLAPCTTDADCLVGESCREASCVGPPGG